MPFKKWEVTKISHILLVSVYQSLAECGIQKYRKKSTQCQPGKASSCRLYKSTVDTDYCKNLLKEANRANRIVTVLTA